MGITPTPCMYTIHYSLCYLISGILAFGSGILFASVIASCSATNNGSHNITLSGKIGVKVKSLIKKPQVSMLT